MSTKNYNPILAISTANNKSVKYDSPLAAANSLGINAGRIAKCINDGSHVNNIRFKQDKNAIRNNNIKNRSLGLTP